MYSVYLQTLFPYHQKRFLTVQSVLFLLWTSSQLPLRFSPFNKNTAQAQAYEPRQKCWNHYFIPLSNFVSRSLMPRVKQKGKVKQNKTGCVTTTQRLLSIVDPQIDFSSEHQTHLDLFQ